MAITSIGSYLTTANQIDAHWTDVNADRLANSLTALVLPGSYSLADFQAERDALQAALIALEDLDNVMQLAIGDRDAQKQNMRERLRHFRTAGKLYLSRSSYLRAIPTMPRMSTSESRFLRPLDDMASLWTRLNAETGIADFTPPLLLTGGYSISAFATDLTTLRANFMAITSADNDLEMARRQRDMRLDAIRDRIQKYRTAIELEYGPGHPFPTSLPEVTPPPGSTPDPVTASAFWNDELGTGVITWTASTNPNLDHYTIRSTPGPSFDIDNNTVLASVPPPETEYQTLEGLTAPMAQVSYRVYVVLTTGNEAGSNAVTITRI